VVKTRSAKFKTQNQQEGSTCDSGDKDMWDEEAAALCLTATIAKNLCKKCGIHACKRRKSGMGGVGGGETAWGQKSFRPLGQAPQRTEKGHDSRRGGKGGHNGQEKGLV